MNRKRAYNLIAKLGFSLMEINTWFLAVVNHQLFYTSKIASVCIYLLAITLIKWSKKEFIAFTSFAGLCIMCYVQSGDQLLLYFPIVLMAMSKISPKELAKMDLYCKIICMTIVCILWLLKVVPDYSSVQFVGESSRIRYTFGYFNPNGFFVGVFFLCIDVLVLFREKINTKHVLVMISIGIFFGQLTYCRTGMIVLVAVIFMLTQWKRILTSSKHSIIEFCLMSGLPLGYGVTFFLVFLYRKGSIIASVISALMSGRIRFASDFLDKYEITWFGQQITTVTGLQALQSNIQAQSLDSFYVYSILAYGVVFCAVLTFFYINAQRKLLLANEYVLSIALFAICIYNMTESIFISCESNLWVIMLCLGVSKEAGGDWLCPVQDRGLHII